MFDTSAQAAAAKDAEDEFSRFRDRFHIPKVNGDEVTYLAGNSLGLQPRRAQDDMTEELWKWATHGVRGHFEGSRPWAPFHELFTAPMSRICGGMEEEVVVMNSLTVNLHLLMVSFYRPTTSRFKILIESHAFPSDHYAVESQLRFHGIDPSVGLLTVEPRPGEETIRADDLIETIRRNSDELALVLLPGVQYYTGQVFPMEAAIAAGHQAGALVGLDLAHAVGNIPLELHDWNADFAAWCTYKYLNGGPGATGAAFVHARHLHDRSVPRFNGWWGHDKATRFEMGTRFVPMDTAEAWQLSNAPVFSMVPLLASLDLFDEAGGVAELQRKSRSLSEYADRLLATTLGDRVRSITPDAAAERGCQLSMEVTSPGVDGRAVFNALEKAAVDCDWRYPNVIRVAPVPLYNSFMDVHRLVMTLSDVLV